MIYVLSLAAIAAFAGFYMRYRSAGFASTLLDTLIAAAFGWLAGLLIGVGARIGMWSIPFFNGAESHFSFDGTTRVVLVFSLYGIGLGILYELLFRKLFHNRGVLFGLLVTLLAWYPLGQQGTQLLKFSPPFLSMAAVTLAIMAITFIPFSVVLEYFLGHWHHFRDRQITERRLITH